MALQSSSAVHLGVENLGVVRHVDDGDLLLLIDRMHHLRELDTVRISKVKGHADEGMVLDGRVREDDRLGNGAADEAADFGRRRVSPAVIDARRNLSGVCGRWYPVILDLHRFFSLPFLELWSIMMIGMVLLLILWYGLQVLVTSDVVWFMLFGIGHFCLGRLVFGIRSGLLCLHLLSVLRTLLVGPIPLVFWLNVLPFLELCIGLLGVWTMVLAVFHMLNFSFSMVRG